METLVAISVFVVVIGISMSLFTDAFAVDRKTKVARLLYEESRVALDRVVKEVRRGTVDYEEYWSWYRATGGDGSTIPTTAADYGKNYGYYALQFFRDVDFPISAPTNPTAKTRYDENVGTNVGGSSFLNGVPALDDATSVNYGTDNCGADKVPLQPDSNGYEQCELYLITADGTEKTILKLIPDTDTIDGETEYRLAMLRLAGRDTDSDSQIDTWDLFGDYQDSLGAPVFQKIQPDSIQITSLKFIVAPLEDPRKAFADFDDAVQIHPYVTVVLTARPSSARLLDGIWVLPSTKGAAPEITLQTTVSTRAQNEVVSLK